jgi:thymidylate kinase
MIIIEGIRRSGKTYTLETVQRNFKDVIHYKDKGMRMIKDTEIDPDDYAIGRDMAYAQLFPTIPFIIFNRMIVDRQYWSSYVYGQFYRGRYDKEFWMEHIHRVENLLFQEGIDRHIHILLIKPDEDDFKRMAEMGRQKDWLEDDNIESYKQQWRLYEELLEISSANVRFLKPFQDEEYIVKTVHKILQEEDEWHSSKI